MWAYGTTVREFIVPWCIHVSIVVTLYYWDCSYYWDRLSLGPSTSGTPSMGIHHWDSVIGTVYRWDRLSIGTIAIIVLSLGLYNWDSINGNPSLGLCYCDCLSLRPSIHCDYSYYRDSIVGTLLGVWPTSTRRRTSEDGRTWSFGACECLRCTRMSAAACVRASLHSGPRKHNNNTTAWLYIL
jgi:hypothetical protein